MNNWTIAGRIGKNAETRHTQGGDSVTSWSVAISNGKGKDGQDRPATWVDCSMWGDRGAKLAQYITKGDNITASGQASARVHDGKAYLQLNVSQVTFGGGKSERGNDAGPVTQTGKDYAPGVFGESEIPF